MARARHLECDELLEHAGWLRALARGLVADAHTADDVVQDTLVAALEHPPRADVPVQSWLAAVARNFVRQERRADLRRRARETRAARPEADPEPERAQARIELERTLLAAVESLGEPWRSAIVARYLEGEPPRVIAARLGLPVKTVQNRLARALELLRARLDRQHGGERRAWMLLLVPLSRNPIYPGLLLGSVLVNTQAKLAVASIALICALAVVWQTAGSGIEKPPASLTSPAAAVRLTQEEPLSPSAPSTLGPERASAVVSSPQPSPAPVLPPPMAPGRVIDSDGLAVAGVAIVPLTVWRDPVARSEPLPLEAKPPAALAVTNARGSFDLEIPLPPQALGVADPSWTTLLAAKTWERRFDLTELVIVVARRIVVAGTVVDEGGAPIARAQVHFRCDPRLGERLGVVLDAMFEVPRAATSDEQGRFELPEVAAVHAASLVASAPGCAEASTPCPLFSRDDVRIVLTRSGSAVVRGEVRDARGAPVEGAWVALRHESRGGADADRWSSSGDATARTDKNGKFAIDTTQGVATSVGVSPRAGKSAGASRSDTPLAEKAAASEESQTLLAVASDSLPAHMDRPETGWPAFVTLELGGPALEIRGRVVDASGASVANARVWTIDESDFGSVVDPLFDRSTGGIRHSLESIVRGVTTGAGGVGKVRSDGEGRFVLTGLMPRSYRLGCMQDSTLLTANSAPIAAGTTDTELVLEKAEHCARVAGRVVSLRGEPIEGANVAAGRPIARWPWIDHPMPLTAPSVRTDAQGRFAFERIATTDLSLIVTGEAIWTPGRWRPPAKAHLDDLEIVVRRRCRIQIDLGDRPGFADSFAALTESGKHIDLERIKGQTIWSGATFPIEDGRSEVAFVPENARTIVLWKGGREATRIPIVPEPGELTVVRP